MKKSFTLFFTLLLAFGVSCFAANFQKETITENERSGPMYSVSNYDTSKPISLLVLLHGMGGTYEPILINYNGTRHAKEL